MKHENLSIADLYAALQFAEKQADAWSQMLAIDRNNTQYSRESYKWNMIYNDAKEEMYNRFKINEAD